MTDTLRAAEPRPAAEVAVQVVDTDIHPAPRSPLEIMDHMPEPWRSQDWPKRLFTSTSGDSVALYTAPNKAQRVDARGLDGGPPGSDPAFTARQLFDEAGVDLGILIPLSAPRPMANQEHELAAAAAMNNWLAAREIERWAGHPRFRQVMVNPYQRAPLGQPHYHPVYAAAARNNLHVAIHVNRGAGMALLTPVGYLSYFWEHHCLYPLLFASHLLSMIAEGVFEKLPALKIVFIEGGFSWLVPLLWRLDRHWQELRSEVPNLKRRPSEYVRDHIRFTSQPVEEPVDPKQLDRVLDLLDAEHILMFATDYPHWDGDYLPQQLFRRSPGHVRHRILAGNALELYGLPATRPASR
ncbi:MAG: amidohydrolase [Chloroflexi bacterium]|nr:amidohydrolase [Chloroflexota bacterium]